MKWKKIGKIFDPTKHQLPHGCTSHAQSPQALVFDDLVRVYFSTRQKDTNGKFLSHIAFVEFDKKFNNILRVSTNMVIELGRTGCFDEHGIFPMNVVRHGNRIYGYTCGLSRRVSVPIDTSIGLAISDDQGLTFKRIGDGPILTATLNEPCIIGDPFVAIMAGQFQMWYIFCQRWIPKAETDGAPSRVYKIAHAVSKDGISWERDGKPLISDKLNPSECQALPTVIHFDNRYHMFFCYRQATGFRTNRDCGYRIGYAYSNDNTQWTRADECAGIEFSESGWDSEMQCYPNVFHCNGNIYMLYNGNEFGRYGFGLAILEK